MSKVSTVITRRGLPGSGLLAAPLRAAAAGARMTVTATAVATGAAGSAALLGGSIAANIGGSLARATPDVSALARAAAGMAIEAIGGPPARRTSSSGPRRWIEVRGLDGECAATIAVDVLAAVRATPGVREAFLNHTLARLVVTVDPDAVDCPSTPELCRIVAAAERRDRTGALRAHPNSLPGDDALLMGRMVAAAAATAGLGLSLTGSLMRLPRLPDLVAVPPTLADHLPPLRREVERRLGPEGADVLFGFVNAATAALTLSPTAAAAEAATRTMLAAEAFNGRLTWARHESALGERPVPDGAASKPRHIPTSARRARGTVRQPRRCGRRRRRRGGRAAVG